MENIGLFGRIPGELRNRIYDLTLTHSPRREASPALLRTCKQVHREAQNILHQNSTFYLDLDLEDHEILAVGDVAGYYSNMSRLFAPAKMGFSPLTSIKTLFPSWASRLKHVAITIDINGAPDLVNYLLLQLVRMINTNNSGVKEVHIAMRHLDRDAARYYNTSGNWMMVLYPIAKLPRELNLTLDMEDFKDDIKPTLFELRNQDQPKIRRLLDFDYSKELEALEADIRSVLGRDLPWSRNLCFGGGCLYTVGQEMWKIISETIPNERQVVTCCYDRRLDRKLFVYTSILKNVIHVLKSGAEADEQLRYLEYFPGLRIMRFSPFWLDAARRYPHANCGRPWRLFNNTFWPSNDLIIETMLGE